MKKLLLLFVLISSLAKSQCNASSFSPVTVCANSTISISQSMQTDMIYVCGQNAVVYDTLNPSSIKYRQVFINSGGRYFFKSTMTNNQVTVYAKNGSFCVILPGSSTTPFFTINEEPTASFSNLSSGTVTVNSCSSITNPTTSINCSPTGVIENAGGNEITIWPNPSKGKFFLSVPSGLTGNVLITDQLGNILVSKKLKPDFSGELSLENFSNGIYYLHLDSGDKSFCKKLIVEK